MNGSWKIRVLKRDSTSEWFDHAKIRLCLIRAMKPHGGTFSQAECLSQAVALYLRTIRCRAVSSRALLEMVLRALRQTRNSGPAQTLEDHHRWRRLARQKLIVAHETGQSTAWDRSWLTQQARRRWTLSTGAARALTAELETQLLGSAKIIRRDTLMDRLDELVEHFGLAPWCLLASAPASEV